MPTTADTLRDLTAAGEPAERERLLRRLRMTPLAVLLDQRALLVEVLAQMPETDRLLRPTWEREDRIGTARLYVWIEGARRRATRSTGHVSSTRAQREVDVLPVAV